MIHEPLTRINSNEYEAIKKICSGSILLNCAINKGLEAKELTASIFNPIVKKEFEKLSDMITRTRYDSQLLDKQLDKTNLVMDALYEIFPLINEANDIMIELSVDNLKEILEYAKKLRENE